MLGAAFPRNRAISTPKASTFNSNAGRSRVFPATGQRVTEASSIFFSLTSAKIRSLTTRTHRRSKHWEERKSSLCQRWAHAECICSYDHDLNSWNCAQDTLYGLAASACSEESIKVRSVTYDNWNSSTFLNSFVVSWTCRDYMMRNTVLRMCHSRFVSAMQKYVPNTRNYSKVKHVDIRCCSHRTWESMLTLHTWVLVFLRWVKCIYYVPLIIWRPGCTRILNLILFSRCSSISHEDFSWLRNFFQDL
jgi:hypothetical protein